MHPFKNIATIAVD